MHSKEFTDLNRYYVMCFLVGFRAENAELIALATFKSDFSQTIK